jgi:DNA invertase Pin-like site-specific DNA recombinase
MKAVALYRVSTREQGDSGLGIENQVAQVHEHCEKNGWTLVSEHYEIAKSGKAPLNDRPVLSEAITAIELTGADVLVVKAMDRLARDPLIHLTIERLLMKMNCRIVSISGEGTDNDDPSSVFYRRIMAATSELEASLISARTKAALASKRARGERLGRPPLGFTSRNGKLIPDHSEDYELVRLVLTERGKIVQKPTPEDDISIYAPPGGYQYKNKWLPQSYTAISNIVTEATGSYCSRAKVARIVKQWGSLENLPKEDDG